MLLGADRLDDGRLDCEFRSCEFRSCESFRSSTLGSMDLGATGGSAGSRRESDETPKRFAKASHELWSMDLSRGSLTCGSLSCCTGVRDSTDREGGAWGFESDRATGSDDAAVSKDAFGSEDAFGSKDADESESPPPKLSWTASVGGLGFLGDDAVERLRGERGLSSDFESELCPGKLPGVLRASGVLRGSGVLRVSSETSAGRLGVFDLAGAIAAVGSVGASVFGVFFERGARFGVPS
jgi:hypothetical protein